MTNTSKTEINSQPNFIIMAVRDVPTDVDCEAIISIEGTAKKLLEAYGFNDINEIESLTDKLADNNFECEFILVSPIVNKALNAAMSISKDWHINFNDVYKSDIVDSIIAAPAVFQPTTYIEAMKYLQHKSVNTPHELNIIEHMALVSMTLGGLGAYINGQPLELQPTIKKSAYYHVKNLCSTQKDTINEQAIDSLVEAILNLFEPCDAPGPIASPEFISAMNRYKALRDEKGEDNDEAIAAFIKAMRIAPDWFNDMAMEQAKEMGLIPKSPHGYTENGAPLYSTEQLAEVLDVPVESVHEKIQKMIDENGGELPEGILVDTGNIHRRQ